LIIETVCLNDSSSFRQEPPNFITTRDFNWSFNFIVV